MSISPFITSTNPSMVNLAVLAVTTSLINYANANNVFKSPFLNGLCENLQVPLPIGFCQTQVESVKGNPDLIKSKVVFLFGAPGKNGEHFLAHASTQADYVLRETTFFKDTFNQIVVTPSLNNVTYPHKLYENGLLDVKFLEKIGNELKLIEERLHNMNLLMMASVYRQFERKQKMANLENMAKQIQAVVNRLDERQRVFVDASNYSSLDRAYSNYSNNYTAIYFKF